MVPLPRHTPHLTTPEPSQLLHWLDELNGPPPTLPEPLHFGHFSAPFPLQDLQVAMHASELYRRLDLEDLLPTECRHDL